MEREIGRPGDEVGANDGRSVKRVIPIVVCSFPFTNINLGRPAIYGLGNG